MGVVCEPEDEAAVGRRNRQRGLAQGDDVRGASAPVVLKAPADNRGLTSSWTPGTCYAACLLLLTPLTSFVFNIYYKKDVQTCTCCTACLTTRDEPR